MSPSAGFIGLGGMGRPMAERIRAAGFELHVFNRSKAVVEALVSQGAYAASSAKEVAEKAEIVFTALPTSETVTAVYADLAAVAKKGQLFIDVSTVAVAQSHACAEAMKAKCASFLDAPISGGPGGAKAGTLTIMVGGAQGDFDRALPLFQACGKNIRLCGPTGAGTVVKLINQLLVGVHLTAIAEAAVFGASLGADPQVVLEVLGTSFGGSTMMTRNLPRFISRDFSPATPVRLLAKDLGLIHDEAKKSGAPLFLGAITEQRLNEIMSLGRGEEDMATMVKLFEGPAQLTVDKPRK